MAAKPPAIKAKPEKGHVIIMIGSPMGPTKRQPRSAPEAPPKRPFTQKSSKPKDW